MRAPRFLPRELMRPGQVAVLALFSALKAGSLLLIAWGLAHAIAALAGGGAAQGALLLAGCGVVLRAAAVWGLNTGARRLGLGAKERLRAALVRGAASRPELLQDPTAEQSIPLTATLASHGIDKLDDYFTKFIPAFIGALTVPLLLGIYILALDWPSAVALLLTVPLVPVFMALIGLHTQDTLRASQSRLDALAHQLYELAQGLPALLGLGRARRHGNAIAEVSERYRAATLANLRTVFLSSFWLELISTLSVAVLAVMIGLRLVGGGMELAAGLSILILAPELFSALREVGSAYHAADDGLAAYRRYREHTAPRPVHPLRAERAANPENLLEIRALSVAYRPGEPVHERLQLSLAPGERRVLGGASGTGKSTVLRLVAEAASSDNGFDAARVSGQIHVGTGIAVIAQHPRFNAATGTGQLAQDVPDAGRALLGRLAGQLGLTGMLERPLGEYSPGELRRLEVLRALARLHSDPGCRLLLADEPTAHLDEANAAAVRTLLRRLPEGCAALIASHDPLLQEGAAQEFAAVEVPRTAAQLPATALPANPDADPDAQPGHGNAREDRGSFNPRRELLRGYRSAPRAIAYGTLGVLCAVALAALSGWLIVQASYQPPILTLSVAFVMVRGLGIGRAAFRYLEQLAIHDAVLGYAGALRRRIWDAMVADPARWGLVSRSAVVLRYLLAEVDELRDVLARVVLPPLQALLVWAAGAVALGLIQPEFGVFALAAGALLALPGRWLVRCAEGLYLARALRHRLWLNQQLLGILGARGALRAYAALERQLQRLDDAESAHTRAARRHALGQGLGPALAALATGALAVAIAAVSHSSAELTALAVLLALALADSAAAALAAAQQSRALGELTDTLSGRGVGAPQPDAVAPRREPLGSDQAPRVHGFALQGVSLGYGDGPAVLQDLDARIEPGAWTAITGPSGSGKSTLLTALLGALPVRAGTLRALDVSGNPLPGGTALHDSVAWCPQEAHLFDSSLRRNLLLGADEQPTADADSLDATLVRVLEQVGLGGWYARQPDGLDTRIGSGGHRLSGGQRCRLAVARALVGGHQVILLDEPTAHLGQDEAAALMDSLRRALAGRTVVLITHDQSLAAGCEQRIRLAGQLQPAA